MQMKKKRVFGFLFSLTLMLGLVLGMNVTAWATSGNPDPNPINLGDGSQNMKDNSEPCTWEYSKDTHTLTLNGCTISAEGNGIYYDGADALTIELKEGSTNSIKSTMSTGIISKKTGLIIQGSGSLEVVSEANTGKEGIDANGDIAIKGDAKVKAAGTRDGIYAGGNVTVSDNAEVTAEGTSNGINLGNRTFTAEGKAKVTATGNYGIYAKTVDIGEDVQLTATGSSGGALTYGSSGAKINTKVVGKAWAKADGTGDEEVIKTGGTSLLPKFKKAVFPLTIKVTYTVGDTGVTGEDYVIEDSSYKFTVLSDLPEGWTLPKGYQFSHWRMKHGSTLVDAMPGDKEEITEDVTFTPIVLEPSPATVTTAPEAKTLTYNGSAQELVTEGKASNGTMQYAAGTDATTAPAESAYSEAIPSGIEAGTYYVWYKAKGAENDQDSAIAGPVEVTIARKAVTVTANDQTVKIGGEIATGVDNAKLDGAAEGHKLAEVKLASSSTAAATTEGEITPSDAVIKDADGTDVTGNYEITYVKGKLTVTAEQKEPEKGPEKEPEVQYEGFIDRVYGVLLGRTVDSAGLTSWKEALEKKEITAAQVVEGVIYSSEYLANNKGELNKADSNDVFVDKMYQAILNRKADDEGKKIWLNLLDQGYSRKFVLAQFVNSAEFDKFCTDSGYNRGKVALTDEEKTPDPANKHIDAEQVKAFVTRLYTVVLGRDPDQEGLDYWVDQIVSRKKTAEWVATYGFFSSKEYLEKNKSATDFLTDNYAAFMDRAPDAEGLKYWEDKLAGGMKREQVTSVGFGKSKEFTEIQKGFGLN